MCIDSYDGKIDLNKKMHASIRIFFLLKEKYIKN